MAECVGHSQGATQLEPLPEDDRPTEQREHDQDREHHFRGAGGVGHELHRRGWYGLANLEKDGGAQAVAPLTRPANHSNVFASPCDRPTSGVQPRATLALSTLTKDSCCSPGRCGANSMFASVC